MKRALAVLVGLCLALASTMAVAAWLSTGSAGATATATTVDKANAPVATRVAGTVSLSWEPSFLASGDPVTAYDVFRHEGSTNTLVCTATSPTCVDTTPAASRVSYGVVARIGTSWRGLESDLTSFTYDDAAPVTTADVSPAPNTAIWNNTSVTVDLQATDPGSPSSGVDHISYTVDTGTQIDHPGASVDFTVAGAGAHTVAYFAVDGAGNAESPQVLTIKIDPSAPTTALIRSVEPNAAGWNNADVTLDFSATDTDASGIKSVTADEVTTNGSTATRTVTAEGTTTVSYFATDNADNVEGTKAAVVKIDRTAPTASVDPASSEAWTTDNTVAITTSDGLSGIASTQYAVDGGALQPYTAPVALADGEHSVRYVVTDTAGNETDRMATVKVDTVDPSSTIAKTATDAWTITASDAAPGGGVSVEYWVDDGSHSTISGSSAVVTVPSGDHTIHWFAEDAAGNTQSQQDLAVSVGPADTDAPVISAVHPGNQSGAWSTIDCGSAAGKVCATVTDDVAVTSVTMTLRKSNDRCWDGLGGTTNFGTTCAPVTMSLTGGLWVPANSLVRVNNNGAASFNDGQYTVTIIASDAAGNTTTATRTFTVSGN